MDRTLARIARSYARQRRAAPAGPAALAFLTLTMRPTLRADLPSAAGGKTAVSTLRWVSTRGEKGPWSEVTAATVAA